MNISASKYIALQPDEASVAGGQRSVQPAANSELLRLRKACREFEAIFISFMLKSMRDATPEAGLLGEGLGSQVYSDIFDSKLAEKMAETGNMKIGDVLYDQYSPLIENAKPADKPNMPETVKPKSSEENEPVILPEQSILEIFEAPQAQVIKPIRLDLPEPKMDVDGKQTSSAAYEDTIMEAANKYGLKPELLKAVIRHESGGNPKAVSPDGAKGLMQLIDSTAKMMGVIDPFNPVQNIMGGAKYLAQLMKKFGGDLEKAIASYNAGPGAVEKYDGVPPYKETKEYVEKVLGDIITPQN